MFEQEIEREQKIHELVIFRRDNKKKKLKNQVEKIWCISEMCINQKTISYQFGA